MTRWLSSIVPFSDAPNSRARTESPVISRPRRVKLRFTRLAALGVACGACSTAGPGAPREPRPRVIATTDERVIRSYDDPSSRTLMLKASPDSAFAALRSLFPVLGIEVKLIDPASGEVGNRNFSKLYRLGETPLREYVNCGSSMTGLAADSYRVTMSVVSRVTPVGTGSKVETQFTAHAEDMSVSKGLVECTTSGTLEMKLHQFLLTRTGG